MPIDDKPLVELRLLNLGCGARFHSDWVNVDFVARHRSVIAHDLRRGIPFPDESFDCVYHSHVLEHFGRSDARAFLRECHRVLKVHGVIRVAVPDLEQIARLYLDCLTSARIHGGKASDDYDWMMIELLDQAVRERPGGEHSQYFARDVIPNLDFVLSRQGGEVRSAIAAWGATRLSVPRGIDRAHRLKGTAAYRFLRAAWRRFSVPGARSPREFLLNLLLGREYRLLTLGRFRDSGELHKWMYDSYSLSRELTEAGFTEPTHLQATQSNISNWAAYNLDTDDDRKIYKPDSLYIEAIKPQVSGRRSVEPADPTRSGE